MRRRWLALVEPQSTTDRVGMNPQVRGDGPDFPMLGEVKATDLGVELGIDHGSLPSGESDRSNCCWFHR